jgi:hypothetical protein
MAQARTLFPLLVAVLVGCGDTTGEQNIATGGTSATTSSASAATVEISIAPSETTTPPAESSPSTASNTSGTSPQSCPADPPLKAVVLPDGFSPELLPGSGGQVTIGTDGVAVPIEPIDVAVRHYAAEPGRYIDINSSALPGYAPAKIEAVDVLGTTGQFGEIEDGFEVTFELPCGAYTLLAYGLSSDDFKEVIASLEFD